MGFEVLLFHCSAHEWAPAQGKSPRQMRGATDPDPFVRDNIESRLCIRHKTVARMDAQIHFVMPIGDIECLRMFSWSRAKLTEIVNATALLHQPDATPRLNRSEQNEPVRVAFHQHVQHPMIAVTEVNVSSTGFVPFDKTARAWPRKSVRGFVTDCRIGFHFDHDSGATAPDQFRAYEFARAVERITLKKWTANNLFFL